MGLLAAVLPVLVGTGCHKHGKEYPVYANVVGIVAECGVPGNLIDLEEIKLEGLPLAEALVLSEGEYFQTTEKVVLEVPVVTGTSSYTYGVLIGQGTGTSAESVVRVVKGSTAVESSSGYTLFWGYRPNGRMRLVAAVAIATDMLLKNQTTPDAAEYVFLLSGGPVNVYCNSTGALLAELKDPRTYLRIKDGGGGSCDAGEGIKNVVGSDQEAFVNEVTDCKAPI
jgi:hypothetical protein